MVGEPVTCQSIGCYVIGRRHARRTNPLFHWGTWMLLAGCTLFPLSVAAQPRTEQEEEAGEKTLLLELEFRLPPYPKPENLLQFEPSAASSNRFFVDAKSI